MITLLLLIITAYLLGSIISAVIVSRLAGLPDPRLQGSGNPGTSNILRIAGKKWAVLVLLLDIAKGMVPVMLAKLLAVSSTSLVWIAFAAVLGHLFPLFFKFKGGKGVATAFGGLVICSPWVGVSLLITWLIVALIWRYSSLAAIVASAIAPVSMLYFANPAMALPTLLIAVSIIAKHHSNIKNLRKGIENKIYARD